MPLIAIIDDRVTNRNILAKLAGSLDPSITVRAFADPRVTLEWVAENTPDLVITDYKMPNMDGAEFIREFRRRPLCFDVPIIVVTVYEDRDFRYRALEAGATDFLLSPLDHHEFRTRVHNLLTLRRQQEIIRKRALTLEEKLILTNRLRTEELRENKEKLGLVINTVPAMIFATDPDGHCIFANSYQCEFFGLDAAEVPGKDVIDLFGLDYGVRQRDLDRQIFETGDTLHGLEEKLTDRQGRKRIFLTTKAALRSASGHVSNVVTVSLDISDRKESEKALRRALEEADSANRTKTEFLANTSHELRTPLNAIIGFAEMMRTELLGPIGNQKYRGYAKDILASAQHLLQIIEDMLDVSKIEAGKLELNESEVDLGRVVTDVLRLVRGRADEAQVELRINLPASLPLLRADERKLKQVFVNLLSNGVKFTPPGGRVSLSASINPAGALQLLVTDTGIGMAEQDIPTAVARFGRVERTIDRKYPGTGLGLPLAIDLIKLHGGTFDISSTVGEGTSVTVLFPADRTIRRANHA